MTTAADRLRSITTCPDLICYLRDELDWPLEDYEFEDLTFEYRPAELGLKETGAAKVKAIHQLRPVYDEQPWGIFFVEFEKKRLPVVILRRILSHLVIKKRAAPHQAAWNLDDLLFISTFGDEAGEQREIAFAHFHQEQGDLPTLRVLGWDGADTPLKLDFVAATLKANLRWPDVPGDAEAWRRQWTPAFRHRRGHIITTADALADALADLARRIRAAATTVLAHESEKGALRQLHKEFRAALIHDLSEADFADTYAQTITYGLLTAAISRTDMSGGRYGTALVAGNITDMVPITNPFLREMLQTFLHAGGRKGGINFDELGIQDVVELLRGDETDLPAILRDFGNRAPGEDPVIHFYEHFLAAYDKKLKVQRGVFYTPRPVVSYIVRSVHELLQTEFGLEDGLASTVTWDEMTIRFPGLNIPKGTDPTSPFVVVLDPATGTATFLVEAIEVIFRTMTAKWRTEKLSEAQQRAAWNQYVPAHLLPRLYGYELMMAPYAIAHMKIGLKLHETGYRFGSDERVRVYLTNALEPAGAQEVMDGFLPALAHEAQAVNEVKRQQRFTVVVGNPPYANFGQLNRIPFILELLEDYKRGLDEKKINLDDDFIKFIRLTQHEIMQTGCGLAGLITNNTFIDGPTRRGMRHSLCETFSRICILDLHGNSIEREVSPDGSPDENVFDIRQGVAITFLSRSPFGLGSGRNPTQVFHGDLHGLRDVKYRWLNDHSVGTTPVSTILVRPPRYRFQPLHDKLQAEYDAYFPLSDIFTIRGSGVSTDRDDLCFDFDKLHLNERMKKAFGGNLEANFLNEFRIVDSSSYDLTRRLRAAPFDPGCIRRCLYRLFDSRWLYYQRGFTSRPAWDVMQHMLYPNLALLAKRQARDEGYDWFFVTDSLVVNGLFSIDNKGREQVFPLWLYEGESSHQTSLVSSRRVNLSSGFLNRLATTFDDLPNGADDLPEGIAPEDILRYIYVVFHSPLYRTRYAEFLKIDFPRLPLPSSLGLFRSLARLGGELVALHLVESAVQRAVSARYEPSAGVWRYEVAGDHRLPIALTFSGPAQPAVEKVTWSDDTVWLDKAQRAGFAGVSQGVWNFHIGGYQVCEKWLKDRKGRVLSADDITHYHRIVIALHETIRLMGEIDAAIEAHGGWPGAFCAASASE